MSQYLIYWSCKMKSKRVWNWFCHWKCLFLRLSFYLEWVKRFTIFWSYVRHNSAIPYVFAEMTNVTLSNWTVRSPACLMLTECYSLNMPRGLGARRQNLTIVCIYLPREGCNIKSTFKRSLTGLNLQLVVIARLKSTLCPIIYPYPE